MLETGKIDGRQATYLLINVIVTEGLLFVPAATFTLARQDAWLANLLAFFSGLFMAWTWVSLSRRFPGKTLFEIFPLLFGPVGGKLAGFWYWWGWTNSTADMLRETTSLLVGAFMANTPLVVFVVAVILLSSYAAYSGLENIARVNQLFIPGILAVLIILFLLAAPEMNFQNLLPVFDAGLLFVVKGSLPPTFLMGHVILLSVLVPYLNRPQDALQIGTKSILVSFFFFELTAVGLVVIFGPTVASAYLAPVLNSARMVHLANFLERLEMLLMVIWITAGVMKIAIYQWVQALGLAQLLRLQSYRPLVVPQGIFLAALAIWSHPDVMRLFNFLNYFKSFYDLHYLLLLPILFLLITRCKGKGIQR